MEFRLKIELGNAAMRTRGHLRYAIRNVARVLATRNEGTPLWKWPHTRGPIADVNGNTVGSWEVVESSSRYTVEPGRWIHRDGVPFVFIGRAHEGPTPTTGARPAEADALTRTIVRLLNEAGE